MKYLPHLLLSLATGALLGCAASGGGAASTGQQTQLGSHGAQNFVLLTHLGARQSENDPNHPHTLALVVTVEQKLSGGEQQITARASAHRDGPGGSPISEDGLSVRVTQPVQFGTEPRRTGEAQIAKGIPATGGKFKTVVAEAILNSPEYQPGKVTVTVPGDQ